MHGCILGEADLKNGMSQSIKACKHKQNFSQAYFVDHSVSLFIFHKVNPPTLNLFLTWDDFAHTLD